LGTQTRSDLSAASITFSAKDDCLVYEYGSKCDCPIRHCEDNADAFEVTIAGIGGSALCLSGNGTYLCEDYDGLCGTVGETCCKGVGEVNAVSVYFDWDGTTWYIYVALRLMGAGTITWRKQIGYPLIGVECKTLDEELSYYATSIPGGLWCTDLATSTAHVVGVML